MVDLKRLSLEFSRETCKEYFITHEKIRIEGASNRVMYFAEVSSNELGGDGRNEGLCGCLINTQKIEIKFDYEKANWGFGDS